MRLHLILSLMLFLIGNNANAETMSFKVVSDGGNQHDCCWIVATGEITADTPTDFMRFVEESQLRGGLIRIVGSGTDIPAAMALGRMIRERNFSTTVGASLLSFDPWYEELDEGECIAGCAIAFFGGTRRTVPSGTELKVGQFQANLNEVVTSGQSLSTDEAIRSRIENQIRTGEVVDYLIEMGIDLRTYAISVSVNPISEPSGRTIGTEGLIEYGIDNTSDKSSDWFAEPVGGWFKVKTQTSLTKRALTMHCSRTNGFVLGFESDQQSIQNILNAIGDDRRTILLSTSDRQFPARIINHRPIGNSQARIDFSIDEVAAQSIGSSPSLDFINVDGPIMRSMFDALAVTFAIRDLPVNSALPARILELCIK